MVPTNKNVTNEYVLTAHNVFHDGLGSHRVRSDQAFFVSIDLRPRANSGNDPVNSHFGDIVFHPVRGSPDKRDVTIHLEDSAQASNMFPWAFHQIIKRGLKEKWFNALEIQIEPSRSLFDKERLYGIETAEFFDLKIKEDPFFSGQGGFLEDITSGYRIYEASEKDLQKIATKTPMPKTDIRIAKLDTHPGTKPRLEITLDPIDTERLSNGKALQVNYRNAQSGETIGSVQLTPQAENHKEVEIGYMVYYPELRGRGATSQAVRAVAESGLQNGWFDMLFAEVGLGNKGSINTAKGIGLYPVDKKCKTFKNSVRFEATSREIAEALAKRPPDRNEHQIRLTL